MEICLTIRLLFDAPEGEPATNKPTIQASGLLGRPVLQHLGPGTLHSPCRPRRSAQSHGPRWEKRRLHFPAAPYCRFFQSGGRAHGRLGAEADTCRRGRSPGSTGLRGACGALGLGALGACALGGKGLGAMVAAPGLRPVGLAGLAELAGTAVRSDWECSSLSDAVPQRDELASDKIEVSIFPESTSPRSNTFAHCLAGS